MSDLVTEDWFDLRPSISSDLLEECWRTGDYREAFFEWHKHVGQVAIHAASVSEQSPAVREIDPLELGVLRGLLGRCSRLMLAEIALSHERKFGETVAILDRCVFETCVKIRWLCKTGEFEPYLTDSLRVELELKERLEQDVVRDGGVPSPIQTRMLRSIERHRALSGVPWERVRAGKRLPPLDQMLTALGVDRLSYLVGQKLGSHAIHGTWSSLVSHYIRIEPDGSFSPRDHDVEVHVNQYLSASLAVLEAVEAFARHIERSTSAGVLSERIQKMGDDLFMFYETAMRREDELRTS